LGFFTNFSVRKVSVRLSYDSSFIFLHQNPRIASPAYTWSKSLPLFNVCVVTRSRGAIELHILIIQATLQRTTCAFMNIHERGEGRGKRGAKGAGNEMMSSKEYRWSRSVGRR